MREYKLTQEQFDELCCAGKLKFVNHNIWLITWLTYFKKLAVVQDIRTEECEVLKVVIEK
jgi:hypothetical protein